MSSSTPQQQPIDDRKILERNLERLISERGVEVIGQLTSEMSQQQIERLIQQTSQKLGNNNGRSRRPFDPEIDQQFQSLNIQQQQQRHSNYHEHTPQYQPPQQPPPPPQQTAYYSSDEEEDSTDKSQQQPRKSNLNKQSKQIRDEKSGSTKNLSVRFDPSQVSPSSSQRRHRSRSSSHRRHHHHHRSGSQKRHNNGVPPPIIKGGGRDTFPRSQSFAGRVGLGDAFELKKEDDASSYCSTCSSSSSDSDDDPYAYELPPRRAYGGVRISYVPNDRMARANMARNSHRRQQSGSFSGSIPQPQPPQMIHQRQQSLRAVSVQPQSMPMNQHHHHHQQPQMQLHQQQYIHHTQQASLMGPAGVSPAAAAAAGNNQPIQQSLQQFQQSNNRNEKDKNCIIS